MERFRGGMWRQMLNATMCPHPKSNALAIYSVVLRLLSYTTHADAQDLSSLEANQRTRLSDPGDRLKCPLRFDHLTTAASHAAQTV